MSDMKDSRDQLESVTTGGQSPGKRDSEGEKPATWGTTISEVLENNNDLFFFITNFFPNRNLMQGQHGSVE